MKMLFRTIDANINRVAEGLRVLEDIARFEMDNAVLSEPLRNLRHAVRKQVAHLSTDLIAGRDSSHDVGLAVSERSSVDEKRNLSDLAAANFKRIQEGLRVIEEHLKVAGYPDLSKAYESFRFRIYDMEKTFCSALPCPMRHPFPVTDIYCLTAEEHSSGRKNPEVVRAMIDAGVKIIQYREKDKSMREKLRECEDIRKLTADAGVTFIVNDNPDLAILTGADGIHVGQDDLPIAVVRKLVGEKMIIGVSTHSPEQAMAAVEEGANYIGVGPIFSTKTKKDVCDPVGFSYLDYVVQHISIPFVAIGGIKEHNIREVAAHGATCIALVTEIVGAENISEKINRLRNEVRK